jgi:hypothetical protein
MPRTTGLDNGLEDEFLASPPASFFCLSGICPHLSQRVFYNVLSSPTASPFSKYFSQTIFLSPYPATTSDAKSKNRKDFPCNWATTSAIFTFSGMCTSVLYLNQVDKERKMREKKIPPSSVSALRLRVPAPPREAPPPLSDLARNLIQKFPTNNLSDSEHAQQKLNVEI